MTGEAEFGGEILSVPVYVHITLVGGIELFKKLKIARDVVHPGSVSDFLDQLEDGNEHLIRRNSYGTVVEVKGMNTMFSSPYMVEGGAFEEEVIVSTGFEILSSVRPEAKVEKLGGGFKAYAFFLKI